RYVVVVCQERRKNVQWTSCSRAERTPARTAAAAHRETPRPHISGPRERKYRQDNDRLPDGDARGANAFPASERVRASLPPTRAAWQGRCVRARPGVSDAAVCCPIAELGNSIAGGPHDECNEGGKRRLRFGSHASLARSRALARARGKVAGSQRAAAGGRLVP